MNTERERRRTSIFRYLWWHEICISSIEHNTNNIEERKALPAGTRKTLPSVLFGVRLNWTGRTVLFLGALHQCAIGKGLTEIFGIKMKCSCDLHVTKGLRELFFLNYGSNFLHISLLCEFSRSARASHVSGRFCGMQTNGWLFYS